MTTTRRCAALVALLFTLSWTAACSGGLGGTGNKGFVDGAGAISVLNGDDRKAPGPVAGQTLDGTAVSLDDYRGKVVVLNVWGSWCAPCRQEVGDLVVAAHELMPKGVVFLGINTRDLDPGPALKFETKYRVPYASIFDPGGKTLLAFRRTLPPAAIPSTVVIDQQGRVAARILGQVPSATTLINVVEDVMK